MSSAWLLPEHIADVLPSQARRIEELRRELLDMARSYGCELVIPPLLEHLDSLLSGTGSGSEIKLFKLVDQLSGRSLGLRADTTPQVARIDAHLLNRQGVTRLCYCGPVAHTRPDGLNTSREPLQFGVEVYGHAGLEADLEVHELALDALRRAGLADVILDLGDARLLQGVLRKFPPPPGRSGRQTSVVMGLPVASFTTRVWSSAVAGRSVSKRSTGIWKRCAMSLSMSASTALPSHRMRRSSAGTAGRRAPDGKELSDGTAPIERPQL